jgi:thiamine-monophosphate kinase
LADVVVLGSAPRGKFVPRSGARAGDDIFVTGKLGGAAAVLHRMMKGDLLPARHQKPAADAKSSGGGALSRSGEQLAKSAARIREAVSKRIGAAAERAHFSPMPRVEVGRWLRERGLVSAMIDISDGLSTDLSHICEESHTGAWIAEAAAPVASGATLEEALNGGDDYELLFTARATKHERIPDRVAGVPVRWIGTITAKPGMWMVAPDMKSRRELRPRGWEHFR